MLCPKVVVGRVMTFIKKKWQDWSSSVKSKRSKIQRERKRTGGRPPPEEDLNPLLNKK